MPAATAQRKPYERPVLREIGMHCEMCTRIYVFQRCDAAAVASIGKNPPADPQPEAWASLLLLGFQATGDEPVVEMRLCPCGATLAKAA